MASIPCRVLIDTGAECEFVSEKFVARAGLTLTPGHYGFAEEAFGDVTEITSQLTAAQLDIVGAAVPGGGPASVAGSVDFAVVPMDAYDIILGTKFLDKAVIDMDNRTVLFKIAEGQSVICRESPSRVASVAAGVMDNRRIDSVRARRVRCAALRVSKEVQAAVRSSVHLYRTTIALPSSIHLDRTDRRRST